MEGDDYGQDYNRGIGQPSPASAAPSGYATTAQPETNLEVNPRLTGAAPASEKKGIADKMKGLLGGHKPHNTDSSDLSGYPPNQQPVYGDATDDTGTTETKVGFVDKIKGKVGLGHHQGSAGSGVGHQPDAHPHGTGAPASQYDTRASSLDPTGPTAGSAFGGQSETFGQPGHHKTDTPYGAGAGAENYGATATNDYRTSSNESGYAARTEQSPYGTGAGQISGMDSRAVSTEDQPGYEARTESSPYGTGVGPTNTQKYGVGNTGFNSGQISGTDSPAVSTEEQPGYAAHTESSPYGIGAGPTNTQKYGVSNAGGWSHPTNPRTGPTGVTNDQGGAVLTDVHGNLSEGPRDDNVKKEGFVGKIMDKLHGPKGTPSSTTNTNTAAPY